MADEETSISGSFSSAAGAVINFSVNVVEDSEWINTKTRQNRHPKDAAPRPDKGSPRRSA